MKKNLLTALVILLFLSSGGASSVLAIDVASVEARIAQIPDTTDNKPVNASVKSVAPTTAESNGAAKLIEHVATEADDRPTRLKAYLSAVNSPLVGEAEHFVKEADKNNLDWKFVAAISGVESTFGRFIPPGSYNGWGWGIPTGAQSGIAFKNWEDAISQISEGLRKNYMDKGALTIEQIGRIYAASPAWSWKVHFFMDQINAYSPKSPKLLQVDL